eukprot:gene9652-9812_t
MQHLEQHGPVIVIPQHLQFTEQQAKDIIHGCCGDKLAEMAHRQLSQVQLLAAGLAHLLTHTSSSHSQDWQPYLQTLPTEPDNPWLMSDPADVSSYIEAYVNSGRLSSAAASDWLLEGGYKPLEAFLKFGFVADEWWEC